MLTAASCVMTAPFRAPRRPGCELHEQRHRRVVGDEQIRFAHERVGDEFVEQREVCGPRQAIDDVLQSFGQRDPAERLGAEHERGCGDGEDLLHLVRAHRRVDRHERGADLRGAVEGSHPCQ